MLQEHSAEMNLQFSKGANEIAKERWEQVFKHGFDEKNDADYVSGQLIQAALWTISESLASWPEGWGEEFAVKIRNKNRADQLTVAGAFLAAEIDRLKSEGR